MLKSLTMTVDGFKRGRISLPVPQDRRKNRLMYPPDILRGSDSYQHLPGILRSLGYQGIEISTSHYIDAYTPASIHWRGCFGT